MASAPILTNFVNFDRDRQLLFLRDQRGSEQGVLTEAELDAVIVSDFSPQRVGFTVLISQKVFIKSFLKSQFRHNSVNLFFILVQIHQLILHHY